MLQLLASNGISVNIQESWGQTPLIIATQQSRLGCMKVLLKHNAHMELRDHHHGNTALHVACTTKDEETVLLLLDAGANPHIVNKIGLSSLGVAIENKFYRALPLLIEFGACMNNKDWEIASGGLQVYIRECTGILNLSLITLLLYPLATPLPLLRLCRVAVRQGLGPNQLEEGLSNVPSSTKDYIQALRDDCCANDVAKKHALLGRTITATKTNKATTKF